MRKILITGIGGDVACAIIRCLTDKFPDDQFYGYDIKKYTPYMDKLSKTFVSPPYTNKQYVSYLKQLIVEYKITHFIPTTEPEILIANKERAFFASYDVKLMINNSCILDVCTSKFKTARFLIDHKISAPETYYAKNYEEQLIYPFIMKADYGRGSSTLKVIHNKEQYDSVVKEDMICQELIGTKKDEYTVGIFCDGICDKSIIYKRELGLGGMSVYVECCDIPEVNNIAHKIADAFQLIGSINAQFRFNNGKYYVFEINPRLSSTVGFRHKMGFQDAVWWLERLDGKIMSDKKYVPPIGKIGVKVTDDVIIPHGGGYMKH